MQIEPTTTEIAAIVTGVLILVILTIFWRRRASDAARSKRAHNAAQGRKPPVEIGETYEFGITEFTDHHSGNRIAVGKVEGFVIFAEDVPNEANVGDAIRVKVHSFNKGRTSADAFYVGSG